MNRTSFGLSAWLSNTRIQLPLAHVETRFRVTGEVAVVEMEQIFEQTARESLDVTYSFPLPGSAAVFRCEMVINGRVTRAVVMEEKEARRVVEEKKAAGHRTALVEMERDNLFTLQLGNAAPGDTIVIRLAYFETLDRLGTQLSLRIPFSPGLRYIPGKPLLRSNQGHGSIDDTDQVPDASRLSPPRITRVHPDAATLYVHGVFDADEVTLASLTSPTHAAVIYPRGDKLEVELALAEEAPDRDFILRWEEKTALEPQPRAWVSAQGEDIHALLQLRAPEAANVSLATDDHVQDIYFLLDRSGSMQGAKWQKCAEALHAFVRELGARDRVWITCFESSFQDFAERLMTRDELLADRSFQTLARLGTAGGTELLPALEHVLKIRESHGTSKSSRLILITDGQVGNEPAVLALMKKPAHTRLPVHCFGIDSAVNDAFLKSLSRQTGGRCALMTPKDDIPAAVRALAVSLRRPVLTDLRLEGDAVLPNEDGTLADLHAGEVVLVPLLLHKAPSLTATITARTTDGSTWRQTFDLQATAEASATSAPRLLWAQRHISHLLQQDRQPEAIQSAIAHNLVCDGASFVAWDEAEKVPVASREVYQPALETLERACAGSANFFEGSVLSCAHSSLALCSDDELVAELSSTALRSAPIHAKKRSFPKSLKPMHEREIMAPALAESVAFSHLLTEFSLRYESWEQIVASNIADWALSFRYLLKSSGLSLEEATAAVIVLYAWMKDSMPRHIQLERLSAVMALSKTPHMELGTFIESHVAAPHLDDLRRIFPWLGQSNLEASPPLSAP
jgi:Ca-activated chloride channel family protein